MYKILSIDGGGIRGIIPAVVLDYIEKTSGKQITSLFDAFAGTSTGAIVTTGINVPGSNGNAKYSAEDIADLYINRGKEIFTRSLWESITNPAGIADEKYDHEPLQKVLAEYFADFSLASSLKPLIIPSYDIEQRTGYFFKSEKAKIQQDHNFYMRDVLRATSAAPTCFEPALTVSHSASPTRRVLIDGGVIANNPAMCAYTEALKLIDPSEKILLISIGTGIVNRSIEYEKAKNWGKAQWVIPMISVLMDGNSGATHHHLDTLLNSNQVQKQYFRFDSPLDYGKDDLDAADAGNIKNLVEKGKEIVLKNKQLLNSVIERLCD